MLSAQHRYGEIVQEGCVREASLEETDQGSANRLVDGGHCSHDRTDASGAEYSLAKASTRCGHLDVLSNRRSRWSNGWITERRPLSAKGYEKSRHVNGRKPCLVLTRESLETEHGHRYTSMGGGSMIELVGFMKKGQCNDGVSIGGGVRVSPGSSLGSPTAGQIQIDVEGWRQIDGSCHTK